MYSSIYVVNDYMSGGLLCQGVVIMSGAVIMSVGYYVRRLLCQGVIMSGRLLCQGGYYARGLIMSRGDILLLFSLFRYMLHFVHHF